MGSGRFDHTAYANYTSTTQDFSREQRFTSRGIKEELNPFGVKFRESRDSADNPKSNAIVIALDVTGSMGHISEDIAKKSLGILFNKLYDEQPVSDPHIMFMGIGDVAYDRAPLQVSQFEADIRIVEQLTGLWLEGGGGGNDHESYSFPWYFAAFHTSIDCFEKRGKKGYLFTVGDEEAPPILTKEQIAKVIGITPQQDYTAEALYNLVSRIYNTYHIIIEEGNYARGDLPAVQNSWNKLIGQNCFSLKDHNKLADGIISIIQRNEGNLGNTRSIHQKELPGYLALLPA